MNVARFPFTFVIILMSLACLSCASAPKKDIDSMLISAFIESCKTAEIKFHGDLEIYVISPIGRLSESGCPMASIKGWREGRIIREKEVEVCECKPRR